MRGAGCLAAATIQLGESECCRSRREACRSWRRVRVSFFIEGNIRGRMALMLRLIINYGARSPARTPQRIS